MMRHDRPRVPIKRMIDRMMPAAKRLFALTFTHRRAGDRFNRRLSEWHLAGVMFGIGVTLLSADTFDLPPYEVVRQIAGQGTWAAFMLVIGGSRLIALVVNGAWPRATAHARYFFASLSAFTWALLLAALLAFDTPLMVGPFLAAAATVDLISAFRAAQAARQADDTREGQDGAGFG